MFVVKVSKCLCLGETEKMKNILELKTINDLRKINSLIPSYQRGYRWTEKEVTDLFRDSHFSVHTQSNR